MTWGRNMKYSIVLVLIAALVLESSVALDYYVTRKRLSQQLLDRAQQDLVESQRISGLKQEIENALSLAMPDINRHSVERDAEALRQSMLKLLQRREIIGVCIGFESGCFEKGLYGFSVFKIDSVQREGVYDIDYTKQPWYSDALESDGCWSEPYKGHLSRHLKFSYSLPIKDAQQHPIGVVAVDVALKDLSSMASQIYENRQDMLPFTIAFHVLGLLVLGFIIQYFMKTLQRLYKVDNERERIEGELSVAKDIQMALLPKVFPPYPDRDDVDIYASLVPAWEVGGDLYDYYIRDEKLFFCIGDVSGKGVPASLFMSITRTLFRNITMREAKPNRILMAMNKTLSTDNSSSNFVTFFLGILDLPTGVLRYCCAGHEPPVLITEKVGENGVASTVCTLLPCEENMPLGSIADWDYAVQETTILPQTTLFLFTDGLSEAMNAREALFGKERMTAVLNTIDPKSIIEGMNSAVKGFVGDAVQSDDLTMMAISYTRKPHEAYMLRRIVLPNDIRESPRLLEFVDSVCQGINLSSKLTLQVRLAVEETVVNVMDYAYPKGSKGTVTIEAQADDERLKFTIIDSGKPFDPTAHPEVDITKPGDERTVGGLGIHLIRRMVDSINYNRIDGENVLTLRKNIKDNK